MDGQDDSGRVNLLTILNGEATRKRRRSGQEVDQTDWNGLAKDHGRRRRHGPAPTVAATKRRPNAEGEKIQEAGRPASDSGREVAEADAYLAHFAPEPDVLTDEAIEAVRTASWETTLLPSASGRSRSLRRPVSSSRAAADDPQGSHGFRGAALEAVGRYRDLWISDLQTDSEQAEARSIAAEWLVQHVTRTRNRVLKTNEHLAHAAAEPSSAHRDIRDQGFTRPKVLLLLPFRSFALEWLQVIKAASPTTTLPPRHWDRFIEEYSLPTGASDKFAQPEASARYPKDHLSTFRGNIDDNFRLGIKWTRKQMCLYTDAFSADLLVASPVGLRRMIEREGHADCLSSLEIVVADQLDVMLMQNWDHVNFVFDNLNKIPSQARDADFSRIKPWYLDGRASLLRQTILFSTLPAPEIRSLFASCSNVAGKVAWETESAHITGVLPSIRAGLRQTWSRFPTASPHSEPDDRFDWFTRETLPALMKSAVASAGGVLVFVPTYFDYVRVVAHMEGLAFGLPVASISEYSSNADISRARSAFFEGRASVLIVTERFHFYRRYKIRGAKSIIFYGPPTHPAYYAEFLEYPFLAGAGQEDATTAPDEVAAEVLFSRWDVEQVVRILGWADGRRLVDGDSKRQFLFA